MENTRINNYTSVTIGPILRTLQSARSTKAFWTASYTISFINREFIKTLINWGLATKDDFLIPYVVGRDLNSYGKYSLFPDRIIMKKGIDAEIMQKVKLEVLEELAKIIAKDLNKGDVNQILNFCKAYFRIPIVTPLALPEKDKNGKITNVMFETYHLLDVAELHSQTNALSHKNDLVNFFEKVPGFDGSSTYNFFHQEAFPRENRHFPSTAEIATAEFEGQAFYEGLRRVLNENPLNAEDEKRQEKFYENLRKNQGDQFRNYLKYMAIVQADGDNFGKLIKSIYKNDPSKIKDFSKTIFDFTKEAAQKVSDMFNGYPVYAGGDDILFFAPVAHTVFENGEVKSITTIFDVIGAIDELFNEKFRTGSLKDVLFKATERAGMSYGISIGYYKFPLGEMQGNAVHQLFGVAKKTKKKNAISMKVLKHSGHGFETTFFKSGGSKGAGEAYKAFLTLVKSTHTSAGFFRGVAHTLFEQSATIKSIGKTLENSERNAQFEAFFNQNFNESIHTQKNEFGETELVDFLQKLLAFCQSVYMENLPENEADDEINQNHIKATLEFISFIHNKEENS